MRRVIRLIQRPPLERRLLLQAAWLVGMTRLGLWLLPFATLWRWWQRWSRPRPPRHTAEQPSAARLAWAVRAVARYVPAATCLTQSLAARVLLAWYGQAAQVHIGVAKTRAGGLEAHAWVESQGQVVIGELPDLARFAPLPSLEKKVL
jgi:hypothetical protein